MLKFYKCMHCGNIVIKAVDKGVPVVCCGEPMTELKAGVEDAAAEKHVPELTVEGDVITARIGSVEHPMLDEHYIQFIALETEKGAQIKNLSPGDVPEAKFAVADDKAIAVYELCNLHGLWKKDL
jgi:superoxide reductase